MERMTKEEREASLILRNEAAASRTRALFWMSVIGAVAYGVHWRLFGDPCAPCTKVAISVYRHLW